MDLELYARIHKSPPLGPVLSQMNLMRTFTTHIFKIHINIILPLGPSLTIGFTKPFPQHYYHHYGDLKTQHNNHEIPNPVQNLLERDFYPKHTAQ
jgi:hypothetical protein